MAVKSYTQMRNMISTAELERRWKAVRLAMKGKGLDFLIMQNAIPKYRGYLRWFTDVRAEGKPVSVIFPREDEMTMISSGPRPPSEPMPQPWQVRGVKKRLSLPYFLTAHYTNTYDAELAVKELAPYQNARIGWVNLGCIPASFYNYVTANLPAAKFEDATDLVDDIKAIKSDEEIGLIRNAAKCQDEVVRYFPTVLKPGRMEFEVHADLAHKSMMLGTEVLNIGITVTKTDGGGTGGWRYSNQPLEKGDKVTLLLETDGYGGVWTEIVRIAFLGKAPAELKEKMEQSKEAQRVTVGALKPGADPVDLWDANNAYLRSIGATEERRIYAHGQGYDMMERPSLNPGETMKIKANMNITIHPEVKVGKVSGWVCDNFLVKESGLPERLHKIPQELFEVD